MTRVSKRHLLIVVCLLLVTLLVYARAAGFGFCVMDDLTQIVNNHELQWSAARGYLVHDVWNFPQPQYRNYYRPLFMFWLLINFKLFGLHAAAWHLAAIALQGVVVVMVFRLGLRLLGDELVAAAAALLFAVHPAHVESVVWLSGITEPLVAVFFLGAFLQYLSWRETQKRSSMFFFSLLKRVALLAKETAAALPLLIAIYECLFPRAQASGVRARFAGSARASWAAFAATAVYTVMRVNAMHHIVIASNSIAMVLMTWPLLLWKYLAMMFWPSGLALLYDVSVLKQPTVESFWLPLIFVIACGLLMGLAFARNKLLAFLGLWWLLPLVPALVGLCSFSEVDIMHDRYTYLSSVAFVFFIAWLLNLVPRRGAKAFELPVEPFVILLALVSGWGVLAARQTLIWTNGFTLFSRVVEVSPNNVRGRNLLANQFLKLGRADRALAIYEGTLKLDPNGWDTNFATGVTLFSAGQFQKSEFYLRRSCTLDRTNPLGYLYLAEALRVENHIEEARGVLKEGISSVNFEPELLRQSLANLDRKQ